MLSPRFQAHADPHFDIVLGLLRREPVIDFQSAQECLRDGMPDEVVLLIAATEGRVLVSHDVTTMPGVILIPKTVSIGMANEELVLLWAASTPEDWLHRLAKARRKIQ